MITVRSLAYQILLQLDRTPAHPDRLLRAVFDRHGGLGDRDRALLTELVYGTVRWQRRLDWHIDQLSRVAPAKIQPEIRILLRLGLYQVLLLDRVPNHAALDETIKVAKQAQPPHLVGFVNGILRAAVRRGSDWDWPDPQRHPAEALAIRHSHPDWLLDRLLKTMDRAEVEALCAANNQVAPLDLRVNTLKTSPSELLAALRALGLDATPSPWLAGALRISSPRRDLVATDLYGRGWFQIQDEAAQFVAIILAPEPGERVLDLCAGVGGKTLHCAALMENRGELTALDQAAWKLQQLDQAAERCGVAMVRTLTADLLALDPDQRGLFDRVLLDAPCTGFGVLRRNPDIKWRRNRKDPYRFARTQQRLLDQAARLVRPGGTLVYATCSIFEEENEAVADAFSTQPDWQPVPIADTLPEPARSLASGPYFRSWPHRHGIDGFFAARWLRAPS